ncbi:Kinesin light chain (Partial), partial [Seminavis robusta]|eukprot:Sro1072_g238000.1 Kinesin light chain (652) ;mRNA; r:486-2441
MAKRNAITGNFLSRHSKIYEIENLRGPPGVIRTKGANTVCPIDGRLGAAYVHTLQGEDHVGEATHMLSYSWDYSIGDIVDTLSDFCHQHKLHPKRTYIWICCLCVNQHRVVENASNEDKSGMIAPVDNIDFFAIFGERVKKIQHLLAMMAPWGAPVALTRVWCIFEIFTAHTTDGCKLDIVMPPKEKHSLEQDVIKNGQGINALYETLGKTKIENANASVESDRVAILRKVESDVGYSALNNLVNDLLRGWMHGVLTQLVESREITRDEEYVDFCNQIGSILGKNGEYDAAIKLHQAALSISETALGDDYARTATSYHNIGIVMMNLGDCEGALSAYNEALAIRLSAYGESHPDTAESYNSTGCVLHAKGLHEGALSRHNEALAIRLSILGKNHPSVATTYSNIGAVLKSQGCFQSALSKYKDALAIRLSALGKDHPLVATTYNNIGSVLGDMGDNEGALSKFNEALAIFESVLGKDHPDVATSYNNIGAVLLKKGDNGGALSKFAECLAIWKPALGLHHRNTKGCLEMIESVKAKLSTSYCTSIEMGDCSGVLMKYEECLAIEESALGKDHPSVATSYNNIGLVLEDIGDYETALAKHKEALAIRLSVLGMNHPDVATTCSQIAVLLYRMKDYSGALVKFEECLAIREHVL